LEEIKTNEQEKSTRYKLQKKYDLYQSALSQVVAGTLNSTGNWCLMTSNFYKKYYLTKYSWFNIETYENIICSAAELIKKYDLKQYALEQLLNGFFKHVANWVLSSTYVPKIKTKNRTINYDLHEWFNIDTKERIICSRYDLSNLYPEQKLGTSALGEVLSYKRKTYKRWRLA